MAFKEIKVMALKEFRVLALKEFKVEALIKTAMRHSYSLTTSRIREDRLNLNLFLSTINSSSCHNNLKEHLSNDHGPI
ncbi:hypothetical protein [Oryza sativa Japonica Group]|uniref:Uncharacterized protein n=1 Tax=Oryza sativa subsp. japonica TaxID=39947 RepID=Q5ZDE9_ORYSJ|nr:hypothetical protein [Oryza sativa Japonica Group]